MAELVPTSTIVAAETATTDPNDLWALSRMFMTSWTEGIGLSTSWFTETVLANDGSDKRMSMSGKPSRILKFTLRAMHRRETWLMISALRRMGIARSLVPLYCDVTKTLSQAYFGWTPSITNGAGVQTTGLVIMNLTSYSTPSWEASSNGMVVVSPGGVTVSTVINSAPVYTTTGGVTTLTTPGSVTYTIPINCRIVLPTTGTLSQTAPYAITFSGPGGTYSVGYGATGISVASIAAGIGVSTVNWSGLNLSVFSAMGTVNAQETATFQLTLVGIGVSSANVSVPTPVTFGCDTTSRRFFVGGNVVIAVPSRTSEITLWEVGTIADMGTNFLALETGISRIYPAGTRIYPLIECQLMLSSQVRVITDRLMQVEFTCKESEGPSALPPLLEIGGTSPYPLQLGYPVFYTTLQWASPPVEGYETNVRTIKSGTGDIYEIIGSRPRYVSKRDTYSLTRTAGWKIISFFDFVCGSAWPFFVLSVMFPFDVVSVGTTTISVRAAGPLLDWSDLLYIGVVQRSTNSPFVASISSVSRSGDGLTDTLTLSSSLPSIPATDIRFVSPVYLVRFSTDELEEKWVTDSQVSLTFGVTEVMNEESVTLTGMPT